MAEVLLVIWTQWSRKPSDREISVSVRERANGKRQRENEKRAALPGLRLEMEPCERIASPALSLIPPALSEEPVGLCFCRTHPRAAPWFSPNGGLSRSRPPGPIAGTILAQRAELGSALVRLVHVSAHCWLGRVRDRAACCLPTCCFPWKSNLKILPMCRAWEQFALPFGVNVFVTCCRDGLVCHLLTQHLLATSPPLMFSHFSFERCLDGRFTPPTTSWVASR